MTEDTEDTVHTFYIRKNPTENYVVAVKVENYHRLYVCDPLLEECTFDKVLPSYIDIAAYKQDNPKVIFGNLPSDYHVVD